MIISVFAVAVFAHNVVAQTAASGHEHGGVVWSDEREAAAFARNFDAAIRACDVQVTERMPEAIAAQQSLTSKGIAFQYTAPAIVMAANGTMGRARYHQWLDPHAIIWLTAYMDKPACRVMVLQSNYVEEARPEIDRLAQVDGFWRRDATQSTVGPGPRRDFYTGSVPATARSKPILVVAGPIKVNDDPNGVKLMALVGLLDR